MAKKNNGDVAKDKRYWDKRAADYDRDTAVYENAYKLSVEKTRKILKHEHKVLEIACGTGILTLALAGQVNAITAIDISARMIQIAKEKAGKQAVHNIDFEVADAYSLAYQADSFDVVLLFNVLQVIKNPDLMLREIYRVLKPGGFLVTASDCYAESLPLKLRVRLFADNIGAYFGAEKPFRQLFKKSDIRKLLVHARFKILEDSILHKLPVNYFVLLQK